MNGVTECAATSKIPSSDVIDGQSVIHLQKYVYAFGGKMVGQHLHGSDSVYKYSLEMDTWTQMSSLIQGRYAAAASILSENEIFIAGSARRFGWAKLSHIIANETP